MVETNSPVLVHISNANTSRQIPAVVKLVILGTQMTQIRSAFVYCVTLILKTQVTKNLNTVKSISMNSAEGYLIIL